MHEKGVSVLLCVLVFAQLWCFLSSRYVVLFVVLISIIFLVVKTLLSFLATSMSNSSDNVPTENDATAQMFPEFNESATGSNGGGEFDIDNVSDPDQGSGKLQR